MKPWVPKNQEEAWEALQQVPLDSGDKDGMLNQLRVIRSSTEVRSEDGLGPGTMLNLQMRIFCWVGCGI